MGLVGSRKIASRHGKGRRYLRHQAEARPAGKVGRSRREARRPATVRRQTRFDLRGTDIEAISDVLCNLFDDAKELQSFAQARWGERSPPSPLDKSDDEGVPGSHLLL